MEATKITRIYFATDVHGSEKCWKKLVNAGPFYKADIVILGGDMTGKMIVPVIEQPDGTYKSDFLEREEILTRDELEKHEKFIKNTGYYPYRCSPDYVEELKTNQEKLDTLFSELMLKTIEDWIGLADKRLANSDIKIYVAPGNDDRFDIDPLFEKSSSVLNVEGKVVHIDDYHEMLSSGWTNPTPWDTPRECSEEELRKKIEAMIPQVNNMENCIFNLHAPPCGTLLDNAPHLDENLTPDLSVTDHVGSVVVYELIEKYQPLLGLHGHIHESKGKCQIGRTICVNPGSDYADGILDGYIVDLNKGKIERLFPVYG